MSKFEQLLKVAMRQSKLVLTVVSSNFEQPAKVATLIAHCIESQKQSNFTVIYGLTDSNLQPVISLPRHR